MESVTRFWSHEAQNIRCVREADFDRVSAERGALQARVNELLEDFQELSEQIERRGRQASEFEDRMGELQIENGKLRDRINLLSDAGEHVESHRDRQADILRIERDALQQRLTVQDQRVDELENFLKTVPFGLHSGSMFIYGECKCRQCEFVPAVRAAEAESHE